MRNQVNDKVTACLDKKEYELGRKFTDEEMKKLNLKPNSLHPKWNYALMPSKS
ncbi:MAG: ISAzo13-like element transposase-related protein [Methanosarcinaceae archaeon]